MLIHSLMVLVLHSECESECGASFMYMNPTTVYIFKLRFFQTTNKIL